MNPSHPEVHDFVLGYIEELLAKYKPDGFQLDYCRYNNINCDFSDYSRRAFEQWLGRPVAAWPMDIFTFASEAPSDIVPGPLYKQWIKWRASVIQGYVREVREIVDRVSPRTALRYWGAGWWHAYKTGEVIAPAETAVEVADKNSWYTKAGLNLNWNVGEKKALTVSLKPAVVWYMGRGATQNTTVFNANCAAVEIEAGLTYHFKNSNGEHYMTLCPKQYTQRDIDAINAQVNDLRGQLSSALADADAERARAARLQRELDECNKREPKVVTQTNVIDNSIENLETNVYFEIGKSVVSTAQMPNVERVAIFLKNHPEATCIIKGYASKDGPEDLNIRLANARAKAVYDLLTGKYKIKASRIQSEGNGISEMFSEPEWNRVSICTIQNKVK